MTLRTLNYGNYGIFLIMGHAGFCPSTVVFKVQKNKGPLDLLQGFLKGSMGLSIGVLLKGSIGRLKLPL